MAVYNRIDLDNLNQEQDLFLIRYSQSRHPDFIVVRFNGFITDEHIGYRTQKGENRRVGKFRARTKLFVDKNEMVRGLYSYFVRRKVEIPEVYLDIFETSQHERPELWI